MNRGSLVRLGGLALLWGSGFLWIKLALRGFAPVQIVVVRLALGFLVLAPLALARGLRFPRSWRTWGHLTVAALLANALPYTLFGIGQQTIASNVAGVLNATTPLWTVLVAFIAGTDRRVSVWRAAGLALGFLGTVLIFTPWRSAGEFASWGGIACLAGAAGYGISFVYMGRFITNRGVEPTMLSATQLAAGTGLMVLALPFGGLAAPEWRVDAVLALFVLGVFGTGFAFVLNYRLITDVGPTAASTTTYLLPVVAVALGALVVSEPVTPPMVGGMALVLAGVFLVQRVARPVAAGAATAAPRLVGSARG